MKTPVLGFLMLAACTQLQARIITLTVPRPPDGQSSSNEISIATNEIACVQSWYVLSSSGTRIHVVKDGIVFEIVPSVVDGRPVYPPIKIAGPATLRLVSSNLSPGQGYQSFCTIEITPESFPPDKTIVIPQGDGANITMECSTNLIDWSTASLGVYTNVPSVKFFRLRAERVP